MTADMIAPPEAHEPAAGPTPGARRPGRAGRGPSGPSVAVTLFVCLVIPCLVLLALNLALRSPAPTTAPAATFVPYAPALRTGTLEDQRRVQVETAAEFFISTWLRPAPEAQRLAALAPLMAPGTARRPAARTDLPAATLCCAPELVKVDAKGATYATRLSDGSPITIQGIFTPEGLFLVTDVQG